jgi:hypothetical protein
MADVACFCGCCYSFEGGAGACPRCGEYAVVAPASAEQGSRSGPGRAEAAAVVVPAAEYRRLRALEQLASPQQREDAATAAALAEYREWSAAGQREGA